MKKHKYIAALSKLAILLVPVILALSIRGIGGNPTDETLNSPEFKKNGPMELSPERGRFALIYSLIEHKSFQFELPIAQFATPDLGYKDGKYVSLFLPGVSILSIPGYLLGKIFGLAQVGTFATISLFAFFNFLLIRSIAIRLGANRMAATIGSLIFLFATPAFTYAVTLYQHHVSVFLILASLYALIRWENSWSLLLIWFLIAASITIDFPNLFMMLPVGIYALGRVISLQSVKEKMIVKVKLANLLPIFIVLLPLAFFGWSNLLSYGKFFQLTANLETIKAINNKGQPIFEGNLGKEPETIEDRPSPDNMPFSFFRTRNMLNGFYIHFLSPDRGIIYYAPVILFGFFSFVFFYKKSKIMVLMFMIIAVNILLYSMWGDPWGGWAFGSRYLVPSYALLSVFISLGLTKFSRNKIFILIFYLVACYSISVNTLGALTSSANPPKIEVLSLEKISGHQEKYTYARNIDVLKQGSLKSFVFRSFADNYLDAVYYYYFISGLIILIVGAHLKIYE
ncbi:MAG: hypothetical protein ABIB61_04790 [Candidatus Shapirobacteria bacterium]